MQRIKIDFDNPGLPKRLDVMENDAQSRFFEAELYRGGKAYSAPSGATYSIMYHGFGPQNEGWYDTINDGAGKRAACTVSGNVVTCELARQALQVPGHMTVILCVTDPTGYMLKGWPITANVRNDDYNDGEEVEMYFDLSGNVSDSIGQLKKAIAEAEQAKKDIETKAAEALASIPEDYTELDSNVKQIKEDLVGSPLYGSKKIVTSIDLRIGSYGSPKGNFDNSIIYNASSVVGLTKGDVLSFTEDGYSVKYGLRTATSFSQWLKQITVDTDGEYTVVVRKDNSYTDLTSELSHINTIFGITHLKNEINIPQNYITEKMIDLSSMSHVYNIDVVRDKSIDNTGVKDVTVDLQKCLDLAKDIGYVSLFFRKGVYKISAPLNYTNNTELNFAKGAVVDCMHKDGVVLTNINSISKASNYNSGSLTIKGGTIKRNYNESDTTEQRSIGIQCCQLMSLNIDSTEFIDVCAGNHLIDMSGIHDVVIDNCIFRGMHLPDSIRPTKEANYSYTKTDGSVMYTDLEMIQIDHGKGLSTPSLEENPTRNVTIKNCTFRPNINNPHSMIYRPIGIHSVSTVGRYENIEICNNVFEQSIGRVLSFSNAKNIKINGNTFINTKYPMFSDIIRFTLMIFGKYYNCFNAEIVGNTVNYTVENNDNAFLAAALSDGSVKARNGVIKWNDIGSLRIDDTNLVDFNIN